MSTEIQRSMGRGAAWMVLFKLLDRSLGLISTLLLVRLLTPADFGIVAMAVSITVMAELLSAFGFDVALIQNQSATEKHYRTAWTCNVLLGSAIALVLVLAAAPAAALYNQPDVFWVLCALAANPLLGGLENIGIVAFRKDLQFRKEFSFLLCRKVLGILVTVPLAFWLRSYWALVAGVVASRAGTTLISYVVHPFRPRFSLEKVRDLMVFSKWMLINNVIVFFKERSTDFAIGSLSGARALGLFNISSEFSNLPLTELAAPINRALLPGFAKIQDDRNAIQEAFANACGVMALIAVPAAAGIAAVAPFLVPVILGGQWLDAVPLMELLAPAGCLVMFASPVCAILVAKGTPRSVAYCHTGYVIALLVALVLLMPAYGVLGAAWAVLTAALLSTPLYVWQLWRHVGVAPTVMLRAASRPIAAAAVMLVAVRAAMPVPAPDAGALANLPLLLAGIAFGAAVYVCALGALWLAAGRPPGAERLALNQLQRIVRRGKPA